MNKGNAKALWPIGVFLILYLAYIEIYSFVNIFVIDYPFVVRKIIIQYDSLLLILYKLFFCFFDRAFYEYWTNIFYLRF